MKKLATATLLGLGLAAIIGFAAASPFRSAPVEAAGVEPQALSREAPIPAADNCLASLGLPTNIGVGIGAVVSGAPLLGISSSSTIGLGLPDPCAFVSGTMGLVNGLLGGLPLSRLPVVSGTP